MEDELVNEHQISINDPLLPIVIKNTVIEQWNEGDALFQVETTDGTEWWHTNCDGELIDGFWLDD